MSQTEVYCSLCGMMKCSECDEHDCQHDCLKNTFGYEIKSLDPSKIHLVEIAAQNAMEFADIVEHLNNRIKDSGVKNNIVYARRPIDLETGKLMESNIRIVSND